MHLLSLLKESAGHQLALRVEPRGTLYLKLRYTPPQTAFIRQPKLGKVMLLYLSLFLSLYLSLYLILIILYLSLSLYLILIILYLSLSLYLIILYLYLKLRYTPPQQAFIRQPKLGKVCKRFCCLYIYLYKLFLFFYTRFNFFFYMYTSFLFYLYKLRYTPLQQAFIRQPKLGKVMIIIIIFFIFFFIFSLYSSYSFLYSLLSLPQAALHTPSTGLH